MKQKFLDNLNWILCAFVGFTTLFLLGCASVSAGWISVNSFGLFSFARFAKTQSFWGFDQYSVEGALAASGVFSIFVLIVAVALLATGVFMLLKNAGIFDWKIDTKIGNFETVVKIVMSGFTLFALLSWMCSLIFAVNNASYSVGGGISMIMVFGLLATAVMWLLPIIMKKASVKASATNEEKAEIKAEETKAEPKKTTTKSAAQTSKAQKTENSDAENIEETK